jgi:membrane protein involved in colicin uptake
MARRSLRPQLNQIRIWVRQGRTDAWIAHQLDVSASELREFRRQHDLSPGEDSDAAAEVDLRDEIEAEIEAAAAEEEALRAKAEEEAAAAEAERKAAAEAAGEDADAEEADEADSDSEETESDGSEAEGRPRRRRRGRRGRRGRGPGNKLEGTFDHGEEGYGLWLDPAIQDVQLYSENWAGKRDVTVTIEADQIIIRRAGEEPSGDE